MNPNTPTKQANRRVLISEILFKKKTETNVTMKTKNRDL